MRWRGGRGGRGLQPGQIARFVEPCLLALLRERPRHGYDLIEAMAVFGLEPRLVDSGLVYRTLRGMEAQGWVSSTWETAAGGPFRRVYRLAAPGQAALEAWAAELERTHAVLHRLLERIDSGEPNSASGGAQRPEA